jgi:hypothetical protein
MVGAEGGGGGGHGRKKKEIHQTSETEKINRNTKEA